MAMNNTGNAVPSTALDDFQDNVQVLDSLINGDATEVTGRTGKELKSIAYLQNVLTSLDVGSFTFADTTTGLAGTTSGQYFRVPQGADSLTAFIYYLNNAGVAEQVAAMAGAEALLGLYTSTDGKAEASSVVNQVMYADGTIETVTGWTAYYLPVQAGDIVTFSGTVGSTTSGEVMAYIIQLDGDKNFVASLAEYTSRGSISDTATLTGAASQDGYIYVRNRAGLDFTLTHLSKDVLSQSDVDIAGGIASDARVSTLETDVAALQNNTVTSDVTTATDTTYVLNRVMYKDGTIANGVSGGWRAYYLPVKKGDTITLNGSLGSTVNAEEIAYIIQLNYDLSFVGSIANYTSTGAYVTGSISGVATQDGYVYVRVRTGITPAATIKRTTRNFASVADMGEVIKSIDYSSDASKYVGNTVMYSGGAVATASGWRMYYIPVEAGDVVKMSGVFGSLVTGEQMAYLMQCDSSKSWVSDLYVYTSTGVTTVASNCAAMAAQDGYIAVRVRTSSAYSVVKQYVNKLVHIDRMQSYVEDQLSQKVAQVAGAAKVFSAPYHSDLSSLPESNPDFSGFTSPLNYTFRKQWARRDFYNAADSYMLSYMDLSTNPFNTKSNIFDITAGNVFAYSWDDGAVSFSSPGAAGKTVMFADRYNPFATSEIAISSVTGNATLGILFGDGTQQNYVAARVSAAGVVTCEACVGGAVTGSATFTLTSFSGSVLRVQNTGLALLIRRVNADGTWDWVGRWGYESYIDARALSYLDTWRTFVFAQTDTVSTLDKAVFTGFSNRIASGSNSVSIRFLTYEDGTFIQKGKWMYFLVEGTGTTIGDLYTQIVRINFNSGEVQMIGVILQVRTDGTDENKVIGDDSIKAVYDRNSKTWKGISCGMDYAGRISSDNNRPKLYFETKQDLLQGGVVIVRNSTQLLNSDGTKFGVGSNYVEDIDFYWDSSASEWVLTGNSVSAGCKTFRSPSLKDGIVAEYSTASVPDGVRDTGNQFVTIGGTKYLTSGGTANKLHLRAYETDLTYLGEIMQDVYLDPATTGPWCTLVPYTNGDETEMYLLSFDRSDLYAGLTGASTYDHGGLYCWKAY